MTCALFLYQHPDGICPSRSKYHGHLNVTPLFATVKLFTSSLASCATKKALLLPKDTANTPEQMTV
jgi:hypothetical protein